MIDKSSGIFKGKEYSNLQILLVVGIILLSGCNSGNKTNSDTDKIYVGAYAKRNVNDNILPPFEYQFPKKIKFPKTEVRINAKYVNTNKVITPVIQALIDSLSQAGGGVFILPKGEYLTGRISLKSNVNLHLEEGATLRFSGNIKDYLPVVFTRNEGVEIFSLGACIYAYQQENIAITGKGKLIGPAEGPVRSHYNSEKLIGDQVDFNLPVEKRVFDGSSGDYIFLPMFISPTDCKNVLIEGISLENTAFWNIVPVYCDGVTIRDVSVQSVGIPRGDGIDIESSKNVLIEYCTLSCGDDCFTLKAGRGVDGMRVNKPTENVVVRYCLAKEGHGGITVGSETAGVIKNVFVHDCTFENTGIGIRFKTRRPRGGGGENLYYKRIKMNTRYTAIKWDMLGKPAYVGELANRLPKREVTALTPYYRNIYVEDCEIKTPSYFLKMIGIPESPVENVVFSGVDVMSSRLMTLTDVKNINFKNVTIHSEDSIVNVTNGVNVAIDKINFTGGKNLVCNFKEVDN